MSSFILTSFPIANKDNAATIAALTSPRDPSLLRRPDQDEEHGGAAVVDEAPIDEEGSTAATSTSPTDLRRLFHLLSLCALPPLLRCRGGPPLHGSRPSCHGFQL
uniref:Uncharacterized protein n=1 Tax=Arundo donax TaxID=35708 RepID=A0A0A9AIJ1_ARUDO